jgi:hypothetical protein
VAAEDGDDVVDDAGEVVVSWDVGVKDGFESRGANPELAPKLGAAVPGVAGPAVLPAGPVSAAGSGSGSLLVVPAREVNQLFVAAIACRTACRPLSSMPFVEVEPPGSLPSPSGGSSAFAGSVDPPMSSAGSGTRG